MTLACRTTRADRRDETLSPRQLAILTLIYETVRDTGIQPSYDEIAARLGFRHRSGVECHMAAMVRKGWIELSGAHGRGRAIRLLRKPSGEPFSGFADKPAEEAAP